MPRIRSELLRGFALLAIFFILIVSTDMFFPYSIKQTGYTVVSIQRLDENPQPFEGLAISSRATVVSVVNNGSYQIVEVSEGATLVFPSSLDPPLEGQRILLRGMSWLHSNGTIFVHEFYALDYSSSLIRSIPGIILFIVLFFMVFKIDISRLAFISKTGGSDDS